MPSQKLYGSLKVLGYFVLLLMGSGIIYASTMTVLYWSGIGV